METQVNNPLHGVKLEQIVTELEAHYGWEYMGHIVNIRCFQDNPSVKSSLKFLRRTPWARTKVEHMYLKMLKNQTSKKES
ncbi:MAG TPA: VF530 family protein [Xanthomarina sp.]|nr:VF530 family protein [Xanthomarina sp.]